MKRRIVLTGGGTAGHVTPNLALIEKLQSLGWEIDYIGSKNGPEKNIIQSINVRYHIINTGKLRRYFSWQNFIDPFRIMQGICQAYALLYTLKPDIIFSKGGFVAFPVVFAAWLRKIPIVAHESDLTPGLANRISYPFVRNICVTFAAAKKYFKNSNKIIITGTPLRKEILNGKRDQGLALCDFTKDKPCLLVIGGSQGSAVINQIIRKSLPKLTEKLQIFHICGQWKLDLNLKNIPGYFQIEYATSELPHIFAASDIIVSRAGANTIYEILALKKPHILIPLPITITRGDQIQNANYFATQGVSTVIQEEQLTEEVLLTALINLLNQTKIIQDKINALGYANATDTIVDILRRAITVGRH